MIFERSPTTAVLTATSIDRRQTANPYYNKTCNCESGDYKRVGLYVEVSHKSNI